MKICNRACINLWRRTRAADQPVAMKLTLVELPNDCLLKVFVVMRPRTRASTFSGLYACRRLIRVVEEPLQQLRAAHSAMIDLLTRMSTTRLEVETSETLEWSDSGLNGEDCGLLADCIKLDAMPMLNEVDFGNNTIGDIGAIATVRCAVAAGMGLFYSLRHTVQVQHWQRWRVRYCSWRSCWFSLWYRGTHP